MPQKGLPTVTAIIVAAGASRRMGFDKLSYCLPDGRTVLETSCALFAAHPAVDELVLVAGGNRPQCEAIAAGTHPDVYELDAASRTGVDNVREEIINSGGSGLPSHGRPLQGLYHRRGPHALAGGV